MMQLSDVDNTLIYRINLRNSPKFHVAAQRANGFTVWGVSVYAPEGLSRNSDAFDPNGADWTITQSYISVDDDDVAIKGGTVLSSGAPSAQFMTIAHNHFYSGHGMSIGSETNAGVSDILVNDLTIDGADNGLRIKSDRSRGGIVQRVNYNDVCMRNIDRRNVGGGALLFSAYYTPNAVGSLFPDYRDVRVHNVHNLTPSNQFFVGYDATHPLNIQLDNVILDDQDPARIFASDTVATLGPGPVNFMPAGTNVTVFNAITQPDEPPVDCDWPELLPEYERLYERRAYLPAEATDPVREQVRGLARRHGVRDRLQRLSGRSPRSRRRRCRDRAGYRGVRTPVRGWSLRALKDRFAPLAVCYARTVFRDRVARSR